MGRRSVLAVHDVAVQERTPRGLKLVRQHACAVCCRGGKRRYRDASQAYDALKVAERDRARGDLRRQECRVYQCAACGGWHLTSQSADTAPPAPARTAALRPTLGWTPSAPVPDPGRWAAAS